MDSITMKSDGPAPIRPRFLHGPILFYLRLTAYSSDGQDDTYWLAVENWQGSPYCGPNKQADAEELAGGDAYATYRLSEAYPNPFNTETVIGFQLPESGQVRLSIYDVTGREVDRLVDAFRQAGRFEVRFDAASLPTGVYTYRLETSGYLESKRVVLVK